MTTLTRTQHPNGEVVDEVESLLGYGCTPREITFALGVKIESVIRSCERANRRDLAEPFRKQVAREKEAIDPWKGAHARDRAYRR